MEFDLCSEMTFGWVMVSLGGSLLLLIPTAWILMQGENTFSFSSFSSSSFLLSLSWICDSMIREGEGLRDSPSGSTKTGTPFVLLYHLHHTEEKSGAHNQVGGKLVTWGGLWYEDHKTWKHTWTIKGRKRQEEVKHERKKYLMHSFKTTLADEKKQKKIKTF